MDYGYQLLRHVVQQVFGNLGAAARITVVPILLGYAICAAIIVTLAGPDIFALLGADAIGDPVTVMPLPPGEELRFAGQVFGALLLSLPVLLVTYAWAAVGWHRYVLLEEYPNGFAARWTTTLVKGYIWAIVRLMLMLLAAGILLGVAVGIVIGILPVPGLIMLVNFGATIGFTWVATRLGLVLPAAALGTYMKLGESWNRTVPVASAILLPIIVVPLFFLVLNTVFAIIPLIGMIAGFVLFWLQMLINLALMTTLYGNLIEGRPLN